MSRVSPLLTIPVGVVVERSKAASRWSDVLWRPVAILAGVPEALPWTKLSDDGARARFYAGASTIELYRSETGNYRDNLAADPPLLWVALQPADGDPPFHPPTVTADPAEGEAWTAMPGLVVDSVPMPPAIADAVASFVAEHHIERPFTKRKRDQADPEVLGRRLPGGRGKP